MPGRVFVVNAGIHDLIGVERFGDLVPLTEGFVDPLRMDRTVYTMRQKLNASEQDDYVLLTGPGVLQGIAMALMLLQHGIVHTIRYCQGKYVTKSFRADFLKNGASYGHPHSRRQTPIAG